MPFIMHKNYMSWKRFERGVDILVEQIKTANPKIDAVFGFPRGGLPLAVRLSHKLKVPLITDWLGSEYPLIVDDIVDTGEIMKFFMWKEPKFGTTASLYWYPKASCKPDFYAFEKKPWEWIVFPWEK